MCKQHFFFFFREEKTISCNSFPCGGNLFFSCIDNKFYYKVFGFSTRGQLILFIYFFFSVVEGNLEIKIGHPPLCIMLKDQDVTNLMISLSLTN